MLTPKCSQPVRRFQAHLTWNTALLNHQERTTDTACALLNTAMKCDLNAPISRIPSIPRFYCCHRLPMAGKVAEKMGFKKRKRLRKGGKVKEEERLNGEDKYL